jgi:hypothetical protein
MNSNGQNNHNEKVSADQAWLSLLEDLKQTPLEIPETWPKETKAHWGSEELSLIVTVPHDIDEDWLGRSFLPLAKIYFSEEQDQKQLVIQRKGRAGQDDLLVRVQRGLYGEIVEPEKLVPVPIYMFHHWLPILGASAFWVVTAMRQVSFVALAEEDSVLKCISSRVLALWAPLKHVAISRVLNKEGFSNWFFKKKKDAFEDVAPEYTVWGQVPVSPHHLAWIEEYFKQHTKEGSADAVLESLLDRTGEIRRVKPGELDLPSSYSKQRRTLLDLVSDYFPGNLSQGISDLVIQLEHQITRPNLTLAIPHYFFKKYMDVLGPNEAALIWYLRSLYKEDERNAVSFSGFTRIQKALGCGKNTAIRLVKKCTLSQEEGSGKVWDPHFVPEKLINNWLSVVYLNDYKNGLHSEYEIIIRATEPIHEGDKGYYNRLLKELTQPSQKETGSDSIPSQKETVSDSLPFQNETGASHKETGPSQNETGASQNKTGNRPKTEHYNSFKPNKSLTDSFNDSLIPPQPSIPILDLSTDLPVVGVREIKLEKLLGFESYKHNEKKKLVKLIEKDQEQFLAWVIRNHITAAKFPVRLAVKNLKAGNETEDQYLELARLGWEISAQLASVNENDLSMWDLGLDDDYEDQEELIQVYKKLSKPAKKILTKLNNTDFSNLVWSLYDR